MYELHTQKRAKRPFGHQKTNQICVPGHVRIQSYFFVRRGGGFRCPEKCVICRYLTLMGFTICFSILSWHPLVFPLVLGPARPGFFLKRFSLVFTWLLTLHLVFPLVTPDTSALLMFFYTLIWSFSFEDMNVEPVYYNTPGGFETRTVTIFYRDRHMPVAASWEIDEQSYGFRHWRTGAATGRNWYEPVSLTYRFRNWLVSPAAGAGTGWSSGGLLCCPRIILTDACFGHVYIRGPLHAVPESSSQMPVLVMFIIGRPSMLSQNHPHRCLFRSCLSSGGLLW